MCLQVDVVVTTAGGVEEDLVKCLAPTYRGDFSLPGAVLRSKGLNRIGNLLVPNDNYCKFEDWIIPVFDQMLDEQNSQVLFSLLCIKMCFFLSVSCVYVWSVLYISICFRIQMEKIVYVFS